MRPCLFLGRSGLSFISLEVGSNSWINSSSRPSGCKLRTKELRSFFSLRAELSRSRTRITGWRDTLADDRDMWKRICAGDLMSVIGDFDHRRTGADVGVRCSEAGPFLDLAV